MGYQTSGGSGYLFRIFGYRLSSVEAGLVITQSRKGAKKGQICCLLCALWINVRNTI